MGMKFALGRSGNSREQMNGNSQMNGGGQMNGGSQMNSNGGGQNYQNNGGQMAMPHMNTYEGPQMGGFSSQMNGGAMGMAMSYPVGTVPPGYMPGHPVPSHPQASQMGFLAPLDQMGGDYAELMAEEMRRGRSRSTGRFTRAQNGMSEASAHGSASRGRDHEMGFADSQEDGSEEIHELKKKVKKLTKKLRKLEEELEEKEEEASSKKKKKKRSREEDDDEEDEDDPAKKLGCALSSLIPSLPGLAEQVFNVVASPPPTWLDYLKKKDFSGIAKMEFSELLKAVQEGKPLPELKKEIFHTLAGLLMVCGKTSS